jgi:hypothetical protein
MKDKKMDNVFLKSFHIAGFSYYQGSYVFTELTIGSKIELVRDVGNIHDVNAIELRYKGRKIGYVPKSENSEISAIMNAGYDIFEGVVQQLIPSEHPERQVKIAIFIIPKKDTFNHLE